MAHVLFDLDGTLVDPREGFAKSLSYALTSLGRPPLPDEDVARYIGPPLQHSLAEILGHPGPELVSRAVDLYRERYAVHGIGENEVYPGVVSMLDTLKKQGHRLRLATSKPEAFALQVLEGLGIHDRFDRVHGSGFDGARSEKVELLGYVLDQLPAPDGRSEPVIMVGDRKFDVEGAHAHRMPVIAVLWGFGTRDELEAAGAVMLAATPADVFAAVSDMA